MIFIEKNEIQGNERYIDHPIFEKLDKNFLLLNEEQDSLNNHQTILEFVYHFDNNQVENPLYYNNINVPRYWEIGIEDGSKGKITFWGEKKATIQFREPIQKRFVKWIDWLNTSGDLWCREQYNSYGKLFSKTFFENNKKVAKCYYDSNGIEFAQENSETLELVISQKGKINGYYQSSIDFLAALLNKHGSKFTFGTSDLSLVDSSALSFDYITTQLNDLEELKKKYHSLRNVIDLKNDTVYQAGKIYKIRTKTHFKRNNVIFLLTASDQLESIENLIWRLREFHFFLGARTLVSNQFKELEQYSNVTILENMSEMSVREKLNESTFYLDINYYQEIDDIVTRAIQNDLIVLSYTNTAHAGSFQVPETIFEKGQSAEMAKLITKLVNNSEYLETMIDKQKAFFPYEILDSMFMDKLIGESNDHI